MELTIRKMDISDVPFVYEEEIRIFGKSLGEKTLYYEILYNPLSRYFIAQIDGKRVGYVGSWLTIPNAEILNLFVLEPYRGQGIGKRLVAEVIKVCREQYVDHLTLEVRKSNEHAIRLYHDLGFKSVTTRIKYYEDGEDALLMMRKIGEAP